MMTKNTKRASRVKQPQTAPIRRVPIWSNYELNRRIQIIAKTYGYRNASQVVDAGIHLLEASIAKAQR